ncbi:MAG: hypothetical protein OEV91_07205 [Desulfobulbaceae bacterium]|nr:hypothetical protein [Desulfobulbaceae bacterium]
MSRPSLSGNCGEQESGSFSHAALAKAAYDVGRCPAADNRTHTFAI